MRFRLRTLLIVLAIGPPLVAWLAGPIIDRILYGPPSKFESTLIIPPGGFYLGGSDKWPAEDE
jgi:hypothetical protein